MVSMICNSVGGDSNDMFGHIWYAVAREGVYSVISSGVTLSSYSFTVGKNIASSQDYPPNQIDM
jgi:hypothetical protein